MSLTLLYIAAIDVGIQVVGFIFSYIFQTEKIFDLAGSLTYIAVAITSRLLNSTTIYERQLLLIILVIVWAVRLGSFLFYRVMATGKDSRFETIKTNFFSFFIVWMIQAAWVYFTVFPVLVINQKEDGQNLVVLDYVGIGVWAFGFTFEVISDWQKWKFKNNPDNKGKFINEGLWSISRHPNYFGEITLWIGVFMIAAWTLEGWEWVCVLSPLFVILLIMKVSGIPQLEKGSMERYGENPAYIEYTKTVPELIPIIGWK